MTRSTKKLLSLLLVFVMLLGMLPMSVFATGIETAAEAKGTEIPVTHNVIDITDYKILRWNDNFYAYTTAIEVVGADVAEAYEDGTTVYIVLDANTPDDAVVTTRFQCDYTESNFTASGVEQSFNLTGGACEGTQTVTIAQDAYVKYDVTYNLVFQKKAGTAGTPTVIKETGAEEVYQYDELTIYLRDYFENAATYYLVDGESETAIEGSQYSVNTAAEGEQTLVFAAENNSGRAENTVAVTVAVKEFAGGIIDYKTSSGSFNRIKFYDAEGNRIEDVVVSYDADAKIIDVKLPGNYEVSGKVKAFFELTQNGDVPFITTKTGVSGTKDEYAVNNKFTEKEIALSCGKATFTFYYYNATPGMNNNHYETWTISFVMSNNIPTFIGEVVTPVTAAIEAGENYVADLSGIYTDADGDALTYQVKVDDGAWTDFEGTAYTYTNSVAGEDILQFRAFDGKDYSEDIYTVNLTVSNVSDTFDVNVTIPDGYDIQFYIVSEINDGVVTTGDELVLENGAIKVPENVSMITWSNDGVICGTVFVDANVEFEIIAVKLTAKTAAGDVDPAASFTVTAGADDPDNDAVINVGENGVALLVSGKGYIFTVEPSETYSGMWNAPYASWRRVSANNASVELEYILKSCKSITAPKDAEVTVYYQNRNYNAEEVTPVYTSTVDGYTITYYYYCTKKEGSAQGYAYRATYAGKITKAGFLTGTDDVTLTWNNADKAPGYRGGDGIPNYSDTNGNEQWRAGDNVLLNLNGRGHIALNGSQDVGAFRNWNIINSDTTNVTIEPDFHFEIVAGDKVVTFTDLNSAFGNNWQKFTADGSGTAFVEVSFDAIHVVDGWPAGGWGGAYAQMHNVVYNASNPNTTGLIVVQTDGNAASDVTFNIASDRSQLGREWDAEADTYYITEDTGSVTLAPSAISGVQSVAISNDKGATWTTLTADENGTYTGTVVPGNNIVRVINGNGQTAYQIVRALKLDITVTNITDSSKGSEFDPGDKVQISISGLISPIMKMGGIYNPNSVSGTFSGSDGTTYSIEGQSGGWVGGYGFNGGTYYLNNVVIPENGNLTLSGNCMTVSGFSISIGLHRTITMSGVGSNGNASTDGGNASVLPVIVLGEAEVIYGDVDGDGEITSRDAASAYAIFNETYTGEVTDAVFKAADVDGDGEITSRDAAMIYAFFSETRDSFPVEEN